jgi:hypothetical protein
MLVGLVLGCNRAPDVTAYRAPKDPPPATQTAMPHDHPPMESATQPSLPHDHPPIGRPAQPGLPPDHPPVGPANRTAPQAGALPPGHPPLPSSRPAAGGQAIKWTLPAGWTEFPAGPMRLANFRLGEGPHALVLTVMELGGSGAASAQGNVNRWEQQLGLAPSDAQQVQRLIVPLTVDGRKGFMVDLAGGQQQMLAALFTQGEQTWSFKVVGPAPAVAAQKDNFQAFLQSIRW